MLKKLTAVWHRHPDARNAGAATVELALSAPILITLVLGIVDYGGLMNLTANLLGATRAGGQYAEATWLNPNINAAAGTHQQVCAFAVPCPTVTASTAQFCTCFDSSSSKDKFPCPGAGGNNPCAAKADPRVLTYVAVTATAPYQPLLPPDFIFRNLPNAATLPNSITETSVVRVQ